MFDNDLEGNSSSAIAWNQSVAVFVGICAMFAAGYAIQAALSPYQLANGRSLWPPFAAASALLAASSIA